VESRVAEVTGLRTLDIGNSRQRPKDFPYHAARRTPILQNPFLGPPGGLSKRRMFQAAPIQRHSFALHENCISLTWDVPSAAKAVLQLLDLGQREPGPITVWQGYWYLTYGVIKIKIPVTSQQPAQVQHIYLGVEGLGRTLSHHFFTL